MTGRPARGAGTWLRPLPGSTDKKMGRGAGGEGTCRGSHGLELGPSTQGSARREHRAPAARAGPAGARGLPSAAALPGL